MWLLGLSLLVLLLSMCFSKWVLACITILTGDKESLRDFGNLCEEKRFLNKDPQDWRHEFPELDEKG
jgi:hypothetical protein